MRGHREEAPANKKGVQPSDTPLAKKADCRHFDDGCPGIPAGP